jgi:DNA-binding NarL/FixJ family response regulator
LAADRTSLQQVAVLLVEDEALVAMDIEDVLRAAGARVVGPAMSLDDAMRLAAQADVRLAILDVDLRGQDVFPAADILRARNIPFVFHTGHGNRREISERYPDALVCKKPAANQTLLDAVTALL